MDDTEKDLTEDQPCAGDNPDENEEQEGEGMSPLEEEILATLKTVYDPEVPVCLLYTSPSPRD